MRSYGLGDLIKISTHALREEGDMDDFVVLAPTKISTHALREEGDNQTDSFSACPMDFYPRPPRGGRQFCQAFAAVQSRISTHALREEGDSKCAIKQKLFSGSICTMRYSPRKKRAVFVQAALSLERSLHV